MSVITARPSHVWRSVSRIVRRRGPGTVAALIVAFGAGWASASVPFATRINGGLVQAFSSVGQNLFGEAVFDAVTVPPNPILPQGAVQMDVALDAQIPALMGVFSPVDPCRKLVQLKVQDGTVAIEVDSQAFADGLVGDIELTSLAAFPPAVNRCTSNPTIDGTLR